MYFRILPHSVQTPFSRFLTDLFLVLCLAINFVGTSACCVRRVSSELCHKQISRISGNKRSICGIGEICVRVINMFLLFLCLNTDENVKLFWYSLIITIRGQKRAKMRQKGLLKVPNWKKIIFQLRKYIFPTGK